MSTARALALFAVDPVGLGGLLLRGRAGPGRDSFLAVLKALLPPGTPLRRMPVSIGDDRLLGGLDLAATLAAGRPVAMRGLLVDADGGVLIAPMAERLEQGVVSRVVAAMDTGAVRVERDGMRIDAPSRFGVVALDEGVEDEHVPEALADRLAFHIRCDTSDLEDEETVRQDSILEARTRLPDVVIGDDLLMDLGETAAAFGVTSMRASILTVRAARAAAALAGRLEVSTEDAALAARLTLAPRARRLPALEEPPPDEAPREDEDNRPADEPEGPEATSDTSEDDNSARNDQSPGETLTDAVRAALPADLIASLIAAQPARKGASMLGKSGQVSRSRLRGRPVGSRAGELGSGARLALLDTLRAAAPRQALRRRTRPATAGEGPRIQVRREDFRIVRFRQRSRVATIFVVDASGSAAMHRLAEAKGAVQLLLSECYARRDEAALIAFRGRSAETLLPPTRSLTRVRRSLTRLPGGGGTPLAAGIEMAADMALAAARRGATPALVFLTDGQANVARDGTGDRPRAEADAHAAARLLRALGFATMVVDTSPRPQPRARRLAEELGASYLPLPAADPAKLTRAVRAEIAR